MNDKLGSKIENLSSEQKAQFKVYVKKWTDIGLSCKPIDFDEAVEAVKLVFECSNNVSRNENGKILNIPKNWVYARSPKEAFNIAKKISSKLTIQEFLNNSLWGNHDADWISFYDFMQEVVGIKNIENIEGLRRLAMSSGWVTCVKDTCIIQDRPLSIKFDEQNRTHNEFGPAIEYRDGYSVMMWHGIRVPSEWITDGISADKALKVKNTEKRRAACEIVGWQNILEQLKYKIIDKDEDPMIGTLVEVELPISNHISSDEKFLMVKCGTGRDFAIPVPPDMTTALQANAWTFNIPSDFLKELEVRT